MKIIFELNHPKHYYQFRFLINHFKRTNDSVLIIARDKDVLLNILEEEGHEYIVFGKHGKSILSKLVLIPKLFITYLKIARSYEADIILTKASIYAVLIKFFIKAKIVITPDSEIVWLTRKIVAPLSDLIITPNNYNLEYGKKHKRINGFFEEAYLSPKAFNPSIEYLEKFKISQPFYLLRFIGWDANHDVGNNGFTDKQKIKLYKLLSQYGQVLISAERNKLPKELYHANIKISPSKIHHVLHFANMYIGDSQSMATEAALLGTPAYRYNSFVGENDMTNFIILQNKFSILKNFSSFDTLLSILRNDLDNSDLKAQWLEKRKKYFEKKKDVNIQMLDYLKT